MSQLNINTIRDASGGNNAVLYGVAAPSNSMGFRNRIINGDMRIDQRNAGAATTPAATNTYNLDRWYLGFTQNSKLTVQQNAGGVTPPVGFTNYLGVTTASAATIGASDFFFLQQQIEGFNAADLGFGSASASSVTLSFWVRSSIAGSFAAVLANDYARGNAATYTINAANTWQYVTLSFAGDTTGTWNKNNLVGLRVIFSLGAGSSSNQPTGVWGAWSGPHVTGAASPASVAGATFYITGVQLEAGTVASPFERRDYGRELMMCQRYCLVYNQATDGSFRFFGYTAGSGSGLGQVYFPVQTRVAPTGISVSTPSAFTFYHGSSASAVTNITHDNASNKTANVTISASGLTTGQGCILAGQTAGNKIEFTGMEL